MTPVLRTRLRCLHVFPIYGIQEVMRFNGEGAVRVLKIDKNFDFR